MEKTVVKMFEMHLFTHSVTYISSHLQIPFLALKKWKAKIYLGYEVKFITLILLPYYLNELRQTKNITKTQLSCRYYLSSRIFRERIVPSSDCFLLLKLFII